MKRQGWCASRRFFAFKTTPALEFQFAACSLACLVFAMFILPPDEVD
jgi:hypothetical protein